MLVSQTSFCEETISGVAKCSLFSEATGGEEVQCISMNMKRKTFL